uniref:Bcl-2-like protein 2 n=1 Tax=Trichoplax adhaerens TaxID=10228 RepID=A0A1B1IJN9_TRIAD|nr:Bcl-2-like protein 2 [Trichoplax adhaerens]
MTSSFDEASSQKIKTLKPTLTNFKGTNGFLDDEQFLVYKNIIKDYIQSRLLNEGLLDGPYRCDIKDVKTKKVSERLKEVGNELEGKFKDSFSNMCERLTITDTTAYPTFVGVVNELFSTGINWGRIVAFIVFSSRLAIHFKRNGMPEYVKSVYGWVARYMHTKLSTWIEANRSWDGFLDHFDKKNENEKSSIFTATMAVAIGTCAYFLFNR